MLNLVFALQDLEIILLEDVLYVKLKIVWLVRIQCLSFVMFVSLPFNQILTEEDAFRKNPVREINMINLRMINKIRISI